MKMHELKCIDPHFHDIIRGDKKFEFRKNDRDFNVDDLLYLRCWNPEKMKYCLSDESTLVRVTSILKEGFGLPEGYCIMSITKPQKVVKK